MSIQFVGIFVLIRTKKQTIKLNDLSCRDKPIKKFVKHAKTIDIEGTYFFAVRFYKQANRYLKFLNQPPSGEFLYRRKTVT